MSLQTDASVTSFLIIVLLGSSWSAGTVKNNTTISSGKSPTNNSTPPTVPTAVNKRTNVSVVESTAATLQSERTRKPGSTTYATMSRTSHKATASPRATSMHVTVMSVLLALVISLSAVGIVVAVLFVRWKRTKKMKEGFQEEMSTICLHDELASEALYSSWKPFMDTNDSNGKMKLVIQPTNQDAQNTQANGSTLSS